MAREHGYGESKLVLRGPVAPLTLTEANRSMLCCLHAHQFTRSASERRPLLRPCGHRTRNNHHQAQNGSTQQAVLIHQTLEQTN